MILLILAIFLVCCKDDDGGTPPQEPGISAKIDGVPFTASQFSAQLSGGKFSIIASDNNTQINITINGNMPGNYLLNTSQSTFEFIANITTNKGSSQEKIFTATTGNLSLSQIDATLDYIYGNFSFGAESENVSNKKITNGAFDNLDYTLIKSLLNNSNPAIKGGSVSALIDSIPWLSVNQVTYLGNQGFVITATSSSGDEIQLKIYNKIAGNYVLNDSLSIHQFDGLWRINSSASLNQSYIGITGNLQINAVDTVLKKISGSFSFNSAKTEKTTINITEGKYHKIKFTQ